MMKRVIIAGGGTGGHIFPAIAIAHALVRQVPDVKILFVGAKGRMEMEKVPQAGFTIEGIDIAGFDRRSLIKNIGLPFKLVKSFFQVRRIVGSFKPDAVIGVGGYSSFPVLRYAQQRNIPTFIHESNAFAGKSNQLLGKRAIKIFVAVEGMERFFPKEKLVVTGNPVRSDITESIKTRDEALRLFGLDPSKKTLLSIGGSLGARSINEAIKAGIEKIRQQDVQLIWQTGQLFAEQAAASIKGLPGMWTGAFIRDMAAAFAAADVVISRAGAMSIAELCVCAKPTVFVPYPLAAEDHQSVNARALSDKDAALLIPDQEVGISLVDAALGLIADEEKQQQFSSRMQAFAHRDADRVIAQKIVETI
jgi:UDP-N-acetylglucosamine--N-acetylmuramyl-(pentapeptide) pyrophosphoryl-undecaprenol N-acetylglucosamine transferase